MSLYGALFSGVAGLTSQARKLGVISDNVSNVNTVGYKGGNALFETLVTTTTSTAAYSPGGVIGQSRQLVSKQGLLQATDSSTDIAISGNGFFVVNQNDTGDGQVFYTRSGSFRADRLGNYRNASGFYLMAWPLDRNGLLPGESGNTTYTTSNANISSLQVVNVGNLTGSAAATTNVSIGANLNASQTVFSGAAGTITMDDISTNNYGVKAKDIIVPSSVNHIDRGDKIKVTADGTTHTFTYGGFTRSRNVESGTAASADNAQTLLDASTTLDTNPFAFTPGSNVITVTHTAHGLEDGAVVTMSGVTDDMAGIDSSEFNGDFVITVVDEDSYTIEVGSTAADVVTLGTTPLSVTNGSTTVTVTQTSHGYTTGQSVTIDGLSAAIGGISVANLEGTFTITVVDDDTFTYTAGGAASSTTTGGTSATVEFAAGGASSVLATTRPFAGHILDASDSETRFLGTTGTSGFTAEGLTFTITTAVTGTATFTYRQSSPDVRQKQFNTLSNLAESINNVTGLSARVVNGQLYVGATDATAAVTFENGSTTGVSGPPVQAGIDWVRELGLKDVVSQVNRFSSLQGLYNLATASSDISATLSNPLGQSRLSINADNPLTTIVFADAPDGVTFDAFTEDSPFQTTAGSNEVFIRDSVNASSVSVGDIITLDVSDVATETTLGTDPITTTSGANPTVTVDITGLGFSFTAGETITIAGASAVNGVDVNGDWTIVTASSTSVTFVATGETSTGTSAGGGSSATAAYASFAGIPLTDFEANGGRFEVVSKSSSGYTIEVATEASTTYTSGTGAAGLLVTPHTNNGSLLAEFGLVDSLDSDAYTPQETDEVGPSYDPLDPDLSMASGNVSPQFSRPIRVYDAQGGGHDLNVAFLKTGSNEWAIEIYAVPEDDVSTSFDDGLVAYGNLTFNGDGTLNSIDSQLTEEVTVAWTNGALASAVTFDWGTAGEPFGTTGATTFGQADGLSQFNAAYKVSFANQNGAPVGELTGVSITELGVIVASYSNGQTQDLFKIPLAAFANPDQLAAQSGNVFVQSANSGEFNLQRPGTSGVGKIAAASLEASNVELSQELTDMIVAQRSYQANAKVISTSDSMLNVLNDIIRG